jgi:hypothetical protein
MSLLALAGIGLVATPGTARADFIDFQVVEGAVPGTLPNTFTADKLNGGYNASLTVTPTTPGGVGGCPVGAIACGTWTETAVADFSQYYLNGALYPGTQYIGDSEPNGYLIRGSLISSGNYIQATCQFTAPNICFFFTFTSQTGTLSLDADSVLGGDTVLLTASGVAAGTQGSLEFDSTGATLITGSFNSNFAVNTLAGGIAPLYWPTLALTQFSTTINGDIDQSSTSNVNPITIAGDVSVQFTAVPEPATLSLLSLGLAAGARYARRRRAEKI